MSRLLSNFFVPASISSPDILFFFDKQNFLVIEHKELVRINYDHMLSRSLDFSSKIDFTKNRASSFCKVSFLAINLRARSADVGF
jgi:hypothetical protein